MHNKTSNENEMQKLQQKSKKKYERKLHEQITNVRGNRKFGQVKMCSSLQSQNVQDYLT
jgi:translation elongation factor EF-Ts